MKKLAPYLLLVILFAGAGWYALTKTSEPIVEPVIPGAPPVIPPNSVQPPTTAADEAEPIFQLESDIEPQAIADEPLPELEESDPQFDESLAELLGTDVVNQFITQSNVISRLAPMLDSLSSRQVPPLLNPVKPAGGEMLVESVGDRFVLSPDNYARYDGYIEVLQSTDSQEWLNLYQVYQPLFEQAWVDNGGEGSFTQRAVEVIDELLATPDVPQPIYLTKPEAVYVFEDPVLEAMPAGQKILLRMGSANAEVVKLKLAEIRAGLVAEPTSGE